jgi:hypothetical protein
LRHALIKHLWGILAEEEEFEPQDPDQKFGAARGIRTPDPVITNDVLYRLSYCGETAVSDIGCGLPWQGKRAGDAVLFEEPPQALPPFA